jgi:hypothetical protein
MFLHKSSIKFKIIVKSNMNLLVVVVVGAKWKKKTDEKKRK